jgi:hypothetical protein
MSPDFHRKRTQGFWFEPFPAWNKNCRHSCAVVSIGGLGFSHPPPDPTRRRFVEILAHALFNGAEFPQIRVRGSTLATPTR